MSRRGEMAEGWGWQRGKGGIEVEVAEGEGVALKMTTFSNGLWITGNLTGKIAHINFMNDCS